MVKETIDDDGVEVVAGRRQSYRINVPDTVVLGIPK
jgi:hypothetical protein